MPDGLQRSEMIAFTLEHDYPAGLDRLWATLGQRDYVRQKYRALGARALRLRRFAATAEAIDVDLERDVVADRAHLPAWVRVLTTERQTLRHRSAWHRNGPREAEAAIDITLLGLPLQAHGRGTIRQLAPGACRMTMDWRIETTLPLAGDAATLLFGREVRAALDADHDFTLRYLQSHPLPEALR
ncbi:DUF2505 family protein [Ideonella sp.]|uniref:DUF2505 family protein n=1 Tax=Ideonella sp. TaxID=1929293 RepID=UPI002B46B394|nr:DUF2505 family protein [Ideonella sp.]HJV70120.1 DUF2505 family protein [Ideonella sp.]